MSDPKRANLITVGAPKSAKKIVNKTVRLTINLVESNESKYPELNYKELVIAEERKKNVENGKTDRLDPFSDNDEDVERVARKFEQKYGNNSTYGKKKRRSKDDDFADIGAGYDENDSFIDNTHGYDEMIPPDIDTFLGGFYINCGSLEFKSVPHEASASDDIRRNKRRISSSSSEDDSSDSSSGSESQDTKDPKGVANGALDSHKTEHRKKKNKKVDKQKAKKVRRTDSSAANSGKQTSDDNNHPDGGESVDSRTSHSDSLTSKPSENAITSDSSRDTEMKTEVKLPQPVTQVLDALEASIAKRLMEHPATSADTLLATNQTHIQRLEQTLKKCASENRVVVGARARAARALGVSPDALAHAAAPPPAANAGAVPAHRPGPPARTQSTSENAQTSTNTATTTTTSKNKRKLVEEDELDVNLLSDEQREDMILETIKRLMDLIEEFKPSMFANYNMECERVREEKKKLTSDGATVEKRLPKRRFPWCQRSRSLLARITRLAGSQQAGALLLAEKVLPLFPKGFVRMPTLMRQANINKDVKVPDIKRMRLGSASQILPSLHTQTRPPSVQTPPIPPSFPEQILFPSSLTVTATLKSSPEKDLPKESGLGHIMNSYSLSKDLLVERDKNDKKEELYIPPNNIGSITITPVPSQASQKDKKTDKQPSQKLADKSVTQKTVDNRQPSVIQKTTVTDNRQPSTTHNTNVTENKPNLIRVKSPAALNESVNKKEAKTKKPDKSFTNPEKNHTYVKEKRVDVPLQIDTSFQPIKKDPSPKNKDSSPKTKDLSQKQIESLRVKENNIPRPALVPVHHSPTFAKPDKRPPEVKKSKDEIKTVNSNTIPDVKKKKEIMIVSDLDPLSDQEPVAIDDSSSDVEVIENDKSVSEVPSKDNKVPNNVEEANEDIDILMKNIREMEHSQEPPKFNNTFSGVIANTNGTREERSSVAKKKKRLRLQKANAIAIDTHRRTNFFEQNGWL